MSQEETKEQDPSEIKKKILELTSDVPVTQRNLTLSGSSILQNGQYKNTPYKLLPLSVRTADLTKSFVGVVGFQSLTTMGFHDGTAYYITVCTPKDKPDDPPTWNFYSLSEGKVTSLYSNTPEAGKLPTSDNFTLEIFINDMVNPYDIVAAMNGAWYGDKGVDTIFIRNQEDPINGPPGGTIEKGFSTPYNETVNYQPLSFGILNPKSLSQQNPGGDTDTGEEIYGVRLFRRVVSTLPKKTEGDNPFASGGTIHEETGYILFCYINKILVRVVKSLAIPRAISVLAHDETPLITSYTDENNQKIYVISTNLVSQAVSDTNQTWIVGNGTFPNDFGKILEFDQSLLVNYLSNAPSKSSLWYKQLTPIFFQNTTTPHTNVNILFKQS